jgi:hypothetical protein
VLIHYDLKEEHKPDPGSTSRTVRAHSLTQLKCRLATHAYGSYTYLSYGSINSLPAMLSTKPSCAVVRHQGLNSISSVMQPAKQDDQPLRGYLATTFSMVSVAMRCGFAPALSTTRCQHMVQSFTVVAKRRMLWSGLMSSMRELSSWRNLILGD